MPERVAPARRFWPSALAALLIGSALVYVPIDTQRRLDRWAEELRREGDPAQAVVFDRRTERRKGGPNTTMDLRYDHDGRTREVEVGCVEVCRYPGADVRVWVNPADPADLVTDFGQLSGNRGRVQGLVGALGFGVALLAVLAMVARVLGHRRRVRMARRPPVIRSYPARGISYRAKRKSGRR